MSCHFLTLLHSYIITIFRKLGVNVYISHPGSQTSTKPKKKKESHRLTGEEERTAAEFIQAHPVLFDKSHEKYKDKVHRHVVWQELADELHLTVERISKWLGYMHDRYVRIHRIEEKSGAGAPMRTAKDKWIMEKFAFLT